MGSEGKSGPAGLVALDTGRQDKTSGFSHHPYKSSLTQ